ncbi:lytic murein transglycosylase [Streptomyces sp. NPDC018610]|uniref:lytic transglycosylase domain-containing protein n=1 Tax=Streptomyces sp. NPDC018610 TaxID=3365049 RepID=UPI0037963767
MPARRARRLRARTRQGLRGTAIAVAAVAALTASQGPGVPAAVAGRAPGSPPADGERPAPPAEAPRVTTAPPGDGTYHTELPPLTTAGAPLTPRQVVQVRAESGIPVTVLRAYRAAERSVARTDPGCRLPWQLLAAIGKVESGQARGGAVDARGTTLGRITGPALDGHGFALVRDTDGGRDDGDTVYDRAVGPMQFLPSTWARWGVDGNGDGRADPNNVFDAALAAGHYLCAGDRDLGRAADLDAAILGYNDSRPYLDLVRYWLDFYRRGVHGVPDGKGVVPASPGAGSDTPAKKPTDAQGGTDAEDGGGIVIGPDPGHSAPGSPAPTGRPTRGPVPEPSGGPSAPEPSRSPTESPTADPSGSASPDPGDSPTTPDPSGSASPSASPSDSAAASPSTDSSGRPTAGSATSDDGSAAVAAP